MDRKNPPKDFTYNELNGFFKIQFRLPYTKDKPNVINLKLSAGDSIRLARINCRYNIIEGQVTDFDDKPFKAFISFGPDYWGSAISLWSNSKGFYSVELPTRTYNTVFVDDGSYNVTTLENWGYHIIVDRDETLNFKVGNGKVYNLQVWANNGGPKTYFIGFRPMVLPMTKKYIQKMVMIDSTEFTVIESGPEFTSKDLNITINNRKVDIIAIQKIYEVGIQGRQHIGLPYYFVQVNRDNFPPNGKITVTVEYDKEIQFEGESVRATSRGITQFYNNFSGLSKY